MKPVIRRTAVGALMLLTVGALAGCAFGVRVDAPDAPAVASGAATSAQWEAANARYGQAVCPTNAAREALYTALGTNDLAQLAPVAASASHEFEVAAGLFLDDPEFWPEEIADDIEFLGETSVQLSASWGEVAGAADLEAAGKVGFPDAQTPYEASQRIRAELQRHGQDVVDCPASPVTPTPAG